MSDPFRSGYQSVLAEHYGIQARRVERIHKGLGTINWRVTTDAACFFLKEYLADANLSDEEEGLRLGEYARAHGIPVPAVRPTATGRLLATGMVPAVALFTYVADADSGGALSILQMRQAGEMLGRIHRLLRSYPPHGGEETSAWLAFDPGQKAHEIDSYLQRIDDKPQLDAFDLQTRPLLKRRKDLLPQAAQILKRLPPLTSQVLHNDYSSPNLLFRGPELTAVVDFQPPRSFLVTYELGRIALLVDNMEQTDWQDRAVALVQAYCGVHDPGLDDVRYAPHVWVAQLLRSTYGVKQHYTRPIALQAELDAFWFRRVRAAEQLLQHLDELEARFVLAWKDSR